MHKFISFLFIITIIISVFSTNALAVEFIDGMYEVNIALWHSEDDRKSMAAASVGKTAAIVVENDIKTMYITSSEISIMGIKATLQELKVEDTSGNFVDAKVAARDSKGNPTGFYFIMPNTSEYINVKVNPHIAIMGNIDIGARIKVDYSTLELVQPFEIQKENSTVPENVQPSGKTETEEEIAETNITKVETENFENFQTEKESTVVTEELLTVPENVQPSGKTETEEEIAETNITKAETENFENSQTEKESAVVPKELSTATEPFSVKKESSGISYTMAIIAVIIFILIIIFVVAKMRRKNKS
jgi:hypothetical protein